MRVPVAKVAAAAAICAGAVWLSVAPATAQQQPKTVSAVGSAVFRINRGFTIQFHWAPQTIRVRRGATVTWANRVDPLLPEPHTITIATQPSLPDTLPELVSCGGPGTACAPAAGHFGPNDTVVNPVLNAGPAGLDEVGDSLFLPPPSGGTVPTVSAKITAPAGSVLRYVCAIHPWMQGVIRVREGRHQGA
jgi:plastocyanin